MEAEDVRVRLASNAGAGETSKGIVLNLILVMSALLVIPWGITRQQKRLDTFP